MTYKEWSAEVNRHNRIESTFYNYRSIYQMYKDWTIDRDALLGIITDLKASLAAYQVKLDSLTSQSHP
jgi:hypothetical protein